MLVDNPTRLLRNRHWRSVKILPQRHPRQFKESRCQVDMRGDGVVNFSFGKARSANVERNPDILLKTGRLARRQSVLANVVSVVRSEDNIGVFKLVAAF